MANGDAKPAPAPAPAAAPAPADTRPRAAVAVSDPDRERTVDERDNLRIMTQGVGEGASILEPRIRSIVDDDVSENLGLVATGVTPQTFMPPDAVEPGPTGQFKNPGDD